MGRQSEIAKFTFLFTLTFRHTRQAPGAIAPAGLPRACKLLPWCTSSGPCGRTNPLGGHHSASNWRTSVTVSAVFPSLAHFGPVVNFYIIYTIYILGLPAKALRRPFNGFVTSNSVPLLTLVLSLADAPLCILRHRQKQG
jgi:hypothetical protein